ncbi:hypothetical protein CRG98_005941 [Punica granatum]|uniref:Uncharacterized protein n=1 Tax=Punica granatum TaxID=22663 RepID=A0A2I0KZE9_PUNGR|nr:hypothetical protein CRG98_005941 [Punica granatum]
MAWDYPKDYRGTKIIIEQVLKEYNEEHPIPPIDSQDPYSPDLEALMQLDIDLAIDSPVHPPSQAVEDQPSGFRVRCSSLIPGTDFKYALCLPRMRILHIRNNVAQICDPRKGLPVVACMALLDTRFLEYQHTCTWTIETTLIVGTVFVTIFPNFNMALSNPQFLTTLKVQLHITRAPQPEDEGLCDNPMVQKQMPPIHSFMSNVMLVYFFREPRGKHCYWDACNCGDFDICYRKKRKEPSCFEEAKKNIDPRPNRDADASLSTFKKMNVLPCYKFILKWVRK